MDLSAPQAAVFVLWHILSPGLTCSYFHLQSTKFPQLLSHVSNCQVRFTGYKTIIKTEIFLKKRCFLSTYKHVTKSHTNSAVDLSKFFLVFRNDKKDFIVSSFPLVISLRYSSHHCTGCRTVISISITPSVCCLRGIKHLKITISVRRGGDRQVSSGYNWYK